MVTRTLRSFFFVCVASPALADPSALPGALARPILEHEAVVFQGNSKRPVKMTVVAPDVMVGDAWKPPAGAAHVALVEGERVEYVTNNAAPGSGVGAVMATIRAHGHTGVVPATALVAESGILRAPIPALFVLHPDYACGDACYQSAWILDGVRRLEVQKQVGGEVSASFDPQNRYVAVGADALFVLDRTTGSLVDLGAYTSPRYAPDGTLYARDLAQGAVYVVPLAGKARRVVRGIPIPPNEEGDYGSSTDPPVDFAANGDLVVRFSRKRTIEWRVTPAGKIVSRASKP